MKYKQIEALGSQVSCHVFFVFFIVFLKNSEEKYLKSLERIHFLVLQNVLCVMYCVFLQLIEMHYKHMNA